jgi:hypothetical protein
MFDNYFLNVFVRTTGAKFVHTWLIAFGHKMPKPTLLLTNLSTGERLRRRWSSRVNGKATHDYTKVVKHWIKGQCGHTVFVHTVRRLFGLRTVCYNRK